MPKTDQELLARDAGRDIGAELLEAVRDLKAGRWARKTEFEVRENGQVRRRIERPDGTVERNASIFKDGRVVFNLAENLGGSIVEPKEYCR